MPPGQQYPESLANNRNRFQDGYDESMEETIRASQSQGQRRTPWPDSCVFQGAAGHGNAHSFCAALTGVPLAPTNPMHTPRHQINYLTTWCDDYVNLIPRNLPLPQFVHPQPQFAQANPYSYLQPLVATNTSSAGAALPTATTGPTLPAATPQSTLPPATTGAGPITTEVPARRHRRNVSEASIVSAASISDLDVEATRTQTGITSDQINGYISSPATSNDKWTCLFPGCKKMFGRKENIKSHVQTHLGDRQYKCPTCNKCFVRQHDLKRHAKIHTGIRAYACECRNLFARHDALTRHRQRGMCVGAFDGTVRSNQKRGRPRKDRQDADASTTRATARKQGSQLPSSASSSAATTPATESSDHFPDSSSPELHNLQAFTFNLDTSNTSHGQADTQQLQSTAPMPTIELQPNAAMAEVATGQASPVTTDGFITRRSLSSLGDSAVVVASPASFVSPKLLMHDDRLESSSPCGTTSEEPSPLTAPIDLPLTDDLATAGTMAFGNDMLPTMALSNGPDEMSKAFLGNANFAFSSDNDPTLLMMDCDQFSQDFIHQDLFS
ncbi:hypothetical protein CDD81_4284 [Ophiocordyceps australis]|uniref:C2H2-type domain-containing protein n=1 Tax=Ophiocordyceps australis TaxID=1399860 RepID=A0A2C5XV74_9HYPO|nr:hypothetical protein CDD81_4284 [Ophiocordyceps australis]